VIQSIAFPRMVYDRVKASWRQPLSPLSRAISVLAVQMILPIAAEAQTVGGGTSPAQMINNICTFILGTFGQSVAVLGIIAVGLLFIFGRASLGVIASVVGGIVIMFGASFLGQTLTGGTAG
jgi:type IV secretion system protein VirB2